MATPPRFAVVQDGSRLHYAIPLALQLTNSLERLYTPFYLKGALLDRAVDYCSMFPGLNFLNRLRHRRHSDLDESRVFVNYLLWFTLLTSRRKYASSELFSQHESQVVGDWIIDSGYGAANILHGFVRNVDPNLCRHARAMGISVVVDQMISTRVEERREDLIQARRFPNWSQRSLSIADDHVVSLIESSTWAASDLVTCPSDYVKKTLVAEGVQPHKIAVIPYPIDCARYRYVDRSPGQDSVTIGFVGSVSLRKGIPYLYQVARKLSSLPVQFVLVGPIAVDPGLLDCQTNIRLVGLQSKADVIQWLSVFDIFFFPSTNEGSPGAVMEAMATGLPIVTTPNSGTVVRHSLDGFIHDYDDIDGLAASLEFLSTNLSSRLVMGKSARQRALQFSIENYANKLLKLVSPVLDLADQ